MAPMKPAVFFDRDGIVNASPGPGYVERVADFHLLPAFPAALRLVRARGYGAVVVTNQRGVGKGLMTRAALDAIHDHLRAELAREGLALDDLLCATSVDRADPRLKPNPGMLFEAAQKFGFDLPRSWMIGDTERDIETGRRAGCHTLLVAPPGAPTQAEARVDDLPALVRWLETHLPPAEAAAGTPAS